MYIGKYFGEMQQLAGQLDEFKCLCLHSTDGNIDHVVIGKTWFMAADHSLVAVLVSVCSELARCGYFLQALQILSEKKTHSKTESDPYTGMPFVLSLWLLIRSAKNSSGKRNHKQSSNAPPGGGG